MEDPSCYLHVHGGKFALVPYCREDDKPFTVYEAVEIFSTRVSNETLGKAILSSFQKSRTNVSSNDEGLSLEDIAKLFGERSYGGFEKRSTQLGIVKTPNCYSLLPMKWDGRGWDYLEAVPLELSASPQELAEACRRILGLAVRGKEA